MSKDSGCGLLSYPCSFKGPKVAARPATAKAARMTRMEVNGLVFLRLGTREPGIAVASSDHVKGG